MYYKEMVRKIAVLPSLFERHHKLQEEWEYIEDPTYSRSIGSHVCITCSRFDYTSQASCGSILYCIWHQKLIFQGEHLSHSCHHYQKKSKLSYSKKTSSHINSCMTNLNLIKT